MVFRNNDILIGNTLYNMDFFGGRSSTVSPNDSGIRKVSAYHGNLPCCPLPVQDVISNGKTHVDLLCRKVEAEAKKPRISARKLDLGAHARRLEKLGCTQT